MDVTIVIKTFLRYPACNKTINRFKELVPDVPILVVDDTPYSHRQILKGVTQICTKPYLRLGPARNLGFQCAQTPFIFYTDDDTLPTHEFTRANWETCLNFVRDGRTDLLGWGAFDFQLIKRKLILRRVPLQEFTPCRLTNNSFFATKESLLCSPYDERADINTEHCSFFFDYVKRYKVAGSNLIKMYNLQWRNPYYFKYRHRKTDRKWISEKYGYESAPWPK